MNAKDFFKNCFVIYTKISYRLQSWVAKKSRHGQVLYLWLHFEGL